MRHEQGCGPGLDHLIHISFQKPTSFQTAQDVTLCKQVHLLQQTEALGSAPRCDAHICYAFTNDVFGTFPILIHAYAGVHIKHDCFPARARARRHKEVRLPQPCSVDLTCEWLASCEDGLQAPTDRSRQNVQCMVRQSNLNVSGVASHEKCPRELRQRCPCHRLPGFAWHHSHIPHAPDAYWLVSAFLNMHSWIFNGLSWQTVWSACWCAAFTEAHGSLQDSTWLYMQHGAF